MGLSQLVRPFFEPLPSSGKYPVVGQIGWIPVPNLPPVPNIIEAAREQSDLHTSAKTRYVPMCDDHFKRRPAKSYPILNLHLGETEELIAFPAKQRPAVVVGIGSTIIGGLQAGTPVHHEERRIVMAPIYGLRTDDDPKGFGAILATRVRYLMYQQFFPTFAWSDTRANMPATRLYDGVIRFDRLQFVNPRPPGLRLLPVRLSDQALTFLQASLWAYLHAAPWPELVEAQDLLRAMLPPEADPPI